MEVVYKEGILSRITDEMRVALASGRAIEEIVLRPHEWDEFVSVAREVLNTDLAHASEAQFMGVVIKRRLCYNGAYC